MTYDQLKRRHLGVIAARGLNDGQFLSHRSAALAQGLPLADSRIDRVELCHPTQPKETSRTQRRRRRDVPEEYLNDSCRALPGLLMTNPIWTAADLLRDGTALDGFVAADAYVGGVSDTQGGMLKPYPGFQLPQYKEERTARADENARLLAEKTNGRRARLEGVLDELEARAGHHGLPRARRLLAGTTGLAESAFESLTLLALKHLGVGVIQQQVVFELADDTSNRYDRVDFYLPEFGIIIEADGWEKYSKFGVKQKDSLRRDRRLSKHGTILHIEWRDVMPGPNGYGLARLLREAGVRV